ncbi:MAG: hypothetical protein K0Q51_1161 [Rickettsiaceae bacterium]|jgi:hypothetical protein|nr:hypothetical protein [Rickettsiaceae bacterium]
MIHIKLNGKKLYLSSFGIPIMKFNRKTFEVIIVESGRYVAITTFNIVGKTQSHKFEAIYTDKSLLTATINFTGKGEPVLITNNGIIPLESDYYDFGYQTLSNSSELENYHKRRLQPNSLTSTKDSPNKDTTLSRQANPDLIKFYEVKKEPLDTSVHLLDFAHSKEEMEIFDSMMNRQPTLDKLGSEINIDSVWAN